MKRLFIALLTITSIFILSSCDNDPEPYEFDVPDEYNINLQNLDYIDYLSIKNPVMTIHVEQMGEIKVQLFYEVAPITVDNIIAYIQSNAYQNNEFHRVIASSLIQGGRLEDTACNILGEMNNNDDFGESVNDLSHTPGVISMARVSGNYNSGSSQFFIMVSESPGYDGEYAAFGGVVSGFHLIDYIASLEFQGTQVPVAPIVITDITIELNGYVPSNRVCYEE